MDKEIKEKWLEALRSGKYRQTTERLARKGNHRTKYCCLGVLCTVMGVRKERDWGAYSFDGEYDNLSAKLRKESGVHKKSMQKLIDLNDDKGYSFKQIADYIEECL